MSIVLTLLVFAVGVLLGWMLARQRATSAQRELEHAIVRLEAEKSATLAANASIKTEFEALAAAALKSNNESFVALAQQTMARFHQQAEGELAKREQAVATMVKPIGEALAKTHEQIKAIEKDREKAFGGIEAHLRNVQESQLLLGTETRNLVNALRRPEVRGRWGENTLRNVVELSGMVEHCDFDLQQTSADATQRPDMLVRMPGQRAIVVDAKAPLDAFIDAHEARDEASREAALVRHARQVREKVRDLASKAYWEQFTESPDFVVLFVPGDQFLAAAYERDPTLQDYAMSNKVMLTSPSSLIPLLKVVAYGWRQQQLSANAEQIRSIGEELHKRLVTFSEHLVDVGEALDKAVRSHNKAVGSYESRLLPGARKFTELGVDAKTPLPDVERVETLANRPALFDEKRDEKPDG